MGSPKLRTVAIIAASSALTVAAIVPGAAQAESTAGIGSSSGAVAVLRLALGSDALALQLLGERSQTTNDLAAGGPSALESLSPLNVASTLLPALGTVSQPTIETRSTSGENTAATPAVDLGALLVGAPVPGLLTGTIDPIALRSAVDATGAASAASGTVRNLSVLGGLLRTGTAAAALGSNALVTDADAVRGLQIDHLEVLDLAALLDALGLSLADLSIDGAVGLLSQLGLPLPGGLSPAALLGAIDGLLDQTSVVRAQVTTLQGQIDALQVQLAPLTSQLSTVTAQVTSLTSQLAVQQALLDACVVPALCAPIQALVNSLTAELAAATASAATLDSAIDALQAQVAALQAQIDALLATIQGALDQLLGLLDGVLDGLDAASLLTVDNLAAGVTARADDTLATSVASVVGSVGAVRVGGLSLGGLDAGSTGAQLTALADQVTSTLGGILATVDPALGGLVDIDLLEQVTALTEDGGVTKATAGITGLRATITPPDVCSLLGRLGGVQETLGSVLDSIDAALPAVPGPVGAVLGDLGSTVTCSAAAGVAATGLAGGVVSALAQPLTIEALSVAGAATFAVPGAPGAPGTPGAPGQLPSTGGRGGELALAALGLTALGLAMRRLLVRAA